jgi:hypothetical protein
MTLHELSSSCSVPSKCLYDRIFVKEWPIERAVSEPYHKYKARQA